MVEVLAVRFDEGLHVLRSITMFALGKALQRVVINYTLSSISASTVAAMW